jgi:Ca-activated chloride channel homolog
MNRYCSRLLVIFSLCWPAFGQSGRVVNYSETPSGDDKYPVVEKQQKPDSELIETEDVIRIDTDLVVIPVQISDRKGRPTIDLTQNEFKIFENGVEQEIGHFSGDEQPFTVALLLDMSYSSVFKLPEIQSAAFAFVNRLRPDDRVMVVSFAEKPMILCEPTNNRKVLRLAIEGARIASGTSLYSALDLVLKDRLGKITGRKAVVLLSDGVDTTSSDLGASAILDELGENDVLIYPIQYDTFDDVQKSRRDNAQIAYDDNDRPYIVERPRVKGEREQDYQDARDFLNEMSERTGGRRYRVSSTTNLSAAFARIVEELRRTYSLGYYPNTSRKAGEKYSIKIRVYRPGLTVRARTSYFAKARAVRK